MTTIRLNTSLVIEGATSAQVAALQNAATFVNPKYAASARYTVTRQPAHGIDEEIRLFRNATAGLVLPRGMLDLARQVCPDATIVDEMVCERVPLGATKAIVPRDEQHEAVRNALDVEHGVIVMPTGTGKTIVALHLAERLQTPTLILVHTSVLLEQTAAKCRSFLGIEPGIIGDSKDTRGPITIGMVQTFASRGDCGLRDYFGCVILDEAHTAPAETFREVVQLFRARYRFGLTATPRRSDHLEPILYSVIGPIVFQLKANSLPLRFTRVDTGFRCAVPMRKPPAWMAKKFNLTGTPDLPPEPDNVALVNLLTQDVARNALIVDTVAREHSGASLVLSDRVEHIQVLTAALCARGLRAVALSGSVEKVGKVVKRKAAKRDDRTDAVEGLESGRYEVLVSTPAAVGVGFDNPLIRTVFVASPHGNETRAEQSAGRCTRPLPGKAFGRVVDFVDADIEPLMNQWWRRRRVYQRLAGDAARRVA